MGDCRDSHQSVKLPDLFLDFRLLIYLFIGLRLTLAAAYQPFTFETYERQADGDYVATSFDRGMSTFGDFRYYFHLAETVHDGHLPYRDWWFEFPPVWTGLYSGLYEVMSLRGTVTFAAWATILGAILILFDVGNLIVLRRLAERLYDRRMAMALAWCYALLAAPIVFTWWTFEPLVLFWILLSLTWLLEGRDGPSAAITALGTATKYTPILILPSVWKFYERRRALRYTAITLAGVGIVLVFMIAWGGRMAVASLSAQFYKASYQCIWALIDGNMRTGSFPGLATRFDADNAFEPYGHASAISPIIRILPFAAAGLYLFTRRLRRDDQTIVAFFTITLVLFFLWAQGWSPQWIMTLAPLFLLNFPSRNGVLLVLVLTLAGFAEYPMLFMRTGATDGEITGELVAPYVFLIVLRTVILIGIAANLFYRLVTVETTKGRELADV